MVERPARAGWRLSVPTARSLASLSQDFPNYCRVRILAELGIQRRVLLHEFFDDCGLQWVCKMPQAVKSAQVAVTRRESKYLFKGYYHCVHDCRIANVFKATKHVPPHVAAGPQGVRERS